uniref:Protein kinase domain-containing protein n=1 Tax=Periophthalmus magnuspinnatus TaxID=409849 RepID=A0A3B3ZB88_9GOBI
METGSQYVSKLNEYTQKMRLKPPVYEDLGSSGPDHMKIFTQRVSLDGKVFPDGLGNSKRVARHNAAKNAYEALMRRPEESASAPRTVHVSLKQSASITTLKKPQRPNPKSRKSNYDCIEILGNGSYGRVYKAKNQVLQQYRAVKEIQKSLQEVKVLSELLHPNIVRYYTLHDTGECLTVYRSNVKYLFIEMEFCNGGTLRRWIHKKNKEPKENSRQKESLDLADQILSGVEYIHSKKLIHRDLKPENIFFGHDGKLRIGDFGLVTEDSNDDEVVERTEDTGTRNYMAPEQFGTTYDRKVDIWALGLILFELFWRTSTGHERVAVCVFFHIIKTTLTKKPEDRPEASVLKSDLQKWTRTSEEDIDQKTI